jgi:hypothetical protein
MSTYVVRLILVSSLAAAVGIVSAPIVADAASPDVCSLVTADELGATLHSSFGAGRRYVAGSGVTCAFDGTGSVRIATVRVARGKQARVVMASTLRAIRQKLKEVRSPPPTRVAGLGGQAYFSLDTFLGEGSIEVLRGRTFVAVTAAISPGTDPAFVSEPVLRPLAAQALGRA